MKLKKGLAYANTETRTRVAKSGGIATFKKYGPDHFRELGKKGIAIRYSK